jgi:hypothetical protein
LTPTLRCMSPPWSTSSPRVLGTEEFPATAAGHQKALDWMRGHARLAKVES